MEQSIILNGTETLKVLGELAQRGVFPTVRKGEAAGARLVLTGFAGDSFTAAEVPSGAVHEWRAVCSTLCGDVLCIKTADDDLELALPDGAAGMDALKAGPLTLSRLGFILASLGEDTIVLGRTLRGAHPHYVQCFVKRATGVVVDGKPAPIDETRMAIAGSGREIALVPGCVRIKGGAVLATVPSPDADLSEEWEFTFAEAGFGPAANAVQELAPLYA